MSLLVRASGFLLGMIATTLAAMLLFISVSFSDKQIGAAIGDFAASEYGRVLNSSGEIHLALLPWPRLETGALSLSEEDRSDGFASWKSANLELDVLALLRHRLVIRHARIDGLTLRLTRDKAGLWNAANLLDGADEVDAPFSLQLEGLALTHASIIISDALSGRELQWRELDLGTDAWRANRAGRVRLISQVVSSQPTIAGKLSLSARYHLGETMANGVLSALQLHYVGDIGLLTATDATLGLGSLDWRDKTWSAEDAQFAGSASFKKRAMEWSAAMLSVGWHEGLQGKSASARLALKENVPTSANAGRVTGGELRLNLQDIKAENANISSAALDADWQLSAGKAAAQGKLHAQLRHDSKAERLSLERIAGDASLVHPAVNATARATLRGNADWMFASMPTAPRGALNLDASFGNDTLHATISYAAGDGTTQPNIIARLQTQHFDLDRLLTISSLSLPTSEALQGWTCDSVLDAKNLKFDGMLLSSAHVPLQIADGALSLPDHDIALYGGSLAGSLDYAPAQKSLDIHEAMREVQLADLLRDTRRASPLTGLINATLDARSQGSDLASLPDKATGALRLYAKGVHWQGVDLVHSMLSLNAGKAAASSAEQATPLRELSAAFKIDGPELSVDKLIAHSDALALVGTGTIQYASAKVDLHLAVRPANNPALSALRGKRMNLHIVGPLMQPGVALDAQTAAASH